MPSILFNNDNDPSKASKDKTKETNETWEHQAKQVNQNTEVSPITESDFAIFPEWDVVPPNSIINPRIKRN